MALQKYRWSEEPVLEFKYKCLLCEEDAFDEFKKKKIKKLILKLNHVHYVETVSYYDSLLETARNRNDKGGNDTIFRVPHVSDLVTVEGKYGMPQKKKND